MCFIRIASLLQPCTTVKEDKRKNENKKILLILLYIYTLFCLCGGFQLLRLTGVHHKEHSPYCLFLQELMTELIRFSFQCTGEHIAEQ